MSGTPSSVETDDISGLYIKLQAAMLQQALRPSEMDPTLIDWLVRNQAIMKRALANVWAQDPDVKRACTPIVELDRSMRPPYMFNDKEWINSAEFISVERAGPECYDLAKLTTRTITMPVHVLHDGPGVWVYQHLKQEGLLEKCLGLKDGLAIQRKITSVYTRSFGENTRIDLWRSLQKDRNSFWLPYLHMENGRPKVSGESLHFYEPDLKSKDRFEDPDKATIWIFP